MKKTLILLFISSVFFASAQSDKAAEKLLDKVSQRYKKFKTIKADFLYQIENKAEKMTEKQRGTIIIKGNKFRLDVANQVIVCDNKTLWTYSKEVNEVQISHYNPKDGTVKLDDIFTMYNKGFLVRVEDSKKENGKEMSNFELTPKDKKKKIFKIRLNVDKTNQTILKSQVYDKNGTTHSYTITNQVPNIRFEDEIFRFDPKKYPGVEIVDLR